MMAGAGGAMRATGWRATAIRFQQFGAGGLLWHRSLSGRRARGQRRACEIDPAGCSTCASSLCGAVCGNGPVAGSRRRWFVGADRSARIRRRAGDDGPKARRGATNTTLAATQRHPCRSGMVTVDCARPRSCPETVVASGALKDQRKIPAFTISLTHSCARGADDGGRRRRDASYGVARDSHPVSTIRCGGSRSPSLSPTRAREVLMMAGAGGAMRATGWRATAIRFQQFGAGGSRSPSLSPTRAREVLMMAGAGGAMRATGWRATAIRFQQFGAGGLLWHRSLSGRRARGQRRACEIDPAGCSTCASSLCGAVCGNGPVAGSRRRWFVGADRSARIRRRAGDDGPKARRGATNTTLAATQRHPCRSGMVTVDCARPRSCPETVVASGALKDQRKIPAFTISLTHSCARGADDGGRRRRDASYGVARDSHPVSTIRCGGSRVHHLSHPLVRARC